MGQWKQGEYKIQYPDKYLLQKKVVKYKSNLEERVCYFLDCNSNVVKWQYEGMSIPYLKPIFMGGKLHHVEEHKYVIDFYAEIKDNDGSIKKYIIEVKSKSATKPPIKPKRMTNKAHQRYLQECATFAVNSNKWSSAKKYCEDNGIIFKMLLDDQII